MNIIKDTDRLDFLPQQFKSHFLHVENLVYQFADKMLVNYTGGYWVFATEETQYGNAAFMFPKDNKVIVKHIFNAEEYEIDAVLAGMIITSFAIEYLYNKVFDSFLVDKLDALKTVAAEYASANGFEKQYFKLTD